MHPDCPPDAETVLLDLSHTCVWRDGQPWPLRAKDGAVLRLLASRPGELVSKAALLEAVWGDTYVVEAVIKDSIARLRRALGDTARTPRFIETVHGRGYRLLQALPLQTAETVANGSLETALPMPPAWLVGRDAVLTQLHAWLAVARQGQRQVGLLSGEAGLGKTAVVDAFLTQMAARPDVQVLRGQCVAPYGQGEAYLPLFEALHDLCRGPQAKGRLALLCRYAPSWLLHLPGLLSPGERETLQRQSPGASRQRMQREFAEAVEALAAARCVVLVLEDLHWSDVSTLDLLGLLAQRRTPARVLLIGTLRPEVVLSAAHPLRSLLPTLQRQPQVSEVALQPLTEAEVGTYLEARLPAATESRGITQALYRRTEGHPLFLVTLVEHLLRQGAFDGQNGTEPVDWHARLSVVPATVRAVTVQQWEVCSPEEQRLLTVASVAGLRFSAATVAAGLDADLIETEGWCAGLARRGVLLAAQGEVEWPDGTVAARYGFRHALYQQVLYEQIPAAQRVQLHRRIAEREEQGYGEQAADIAARLALHFERGHAAKRAVVHYHRAAATAMHRYAYHEAISNCRQGLALLTSLPQTASRHRQELNLLMCLGSALVRTKGQGAAELEALWQRSHDLCLSLNDTASLTQVFLHLSSYYFNRGAFGRSAAAGQRLISLGQEIDDPFQQARGYLRLGTIEHTYGKLIAARAHLERALALSAHLPRLAQNTGGMLVNCLSSMTDTLLELGYAEQAWQWGQEALNLAQELAEPYWRMWALYKSLTLHRIRGDTAVVLAQSEAVIALCAEHGYQRYWAMAMTHRGCALANQGQVSEGIAVIEQGLAVYRATGSVVVLPHRLALLAEAYGAGGQAEAGLSVVDEAIAIVAQSEQEVVASRLYRLKGELLLMQADTGPEALQAEACFGQALTTARRQQARMRELQAATSLSRLWQAQGKQQAAYDLLAPIYGWFTEGFETVALKKARLLLDELA